MLKRLIFMETFEKQDVATQSFLQLELESTKN